MSLAAGCGPGKSATQRTTRPVIARSYDIQGLRFIAPPDLTVSEREGFYPRGDIVWRGDPYGPRVAQIESMFLEAFERNQVVLKGRTPVNVDIRLVRFHGVTDMARLTAGGVYNIIFDMRVLNARSGEVIEPTHRVKGDLSAPGGRRGKALIHKGQTQRVRVTDFLTDLLRQQLV